MPTHNANTLPITTFLMYPLLSTHDEGTVPLTTVNRMSNSSLSNVIMPDQALLKL